MDRREFLTGIGHAAAFVAAGAQGCEGEAGEPPDIARGDVPRIDIEPVCWFARGNPAATSLVEHFADGSSQCVADFHADAHIEAAWPDGVVPTVQWSGRTLVLVATWTKNSGPWIGRELRRRGNRIEQYVFGDGTWERIEG